MAFHEQDGLHWFSFDRLDQAGARQGVFTRRGGISPAPWASLNLGGTVGDERANVIENRRRMFDAFGRPVSSLYDAWHVHGNTVIVVTEPRPLDTPHLKADILVTDRPEVTLFMRFADCVPVLLYDPARAVIGMAHAGWQGTVNRAAAAAVEAMTAHYGSRPADIIAAIGPSIGVEHYPVGTDVIERARLAFGPAADALLPVLIRPGYDGHAHFDLWAANRLVLEQAGVGQIEVAGICTACHLDDWFSHRGDHGKTGRFGALMALEGK